MVNERMVRWQRICNKIEKAKEGIFEFDFVSSSELWMALEPKDNVMKIFAQTA